MITTLKPLLKQRLSEIGIKTIFTDQEDESKIKGLDYAWIFAAAPEEVIKDGRTVVVKNGAFYLQSNKLRLKVIIRLATKTEALAGELKEALLVQLATNPLAVDGHGFDIRLEALTAEALTDKSVLKIGYGYDFTLETVGGMYKQIASAEVDAWLAAVTNWTAAQLPDWKVYPFYPMGRPDGSIYWELTTATLTDQGAFWYRVRKRFVCHIFGQDDVIMMAALKLSNALMEAFKIPLDAANKKYLLVDKPEIQLRGSDPETSGQLVMTLTRFTTRTVEEAYLMERFYPTGTLQGG